MVRDRRCAIEMCIIRDEMLKSGGSVRRVGHAAMAIDPMTKYGGNWEAMQRRMATAEYGLVEESARLVLRKEDDSMKDRVHSHLKQAACAGTSWSHQQIKMCMHAH